MARRYDVRALLGEDFELELTPEVLAYELSMDFSNQVAKCCAERGIKLGEFASMLGIGISTLSEKLNGQNLTLKSIASMAIALGCDVRAPELVTAQDPASAIDTTCTTANVKSEIAHALVDFNDCQEAENVEETESVLSIVSSSAPDYQLRSIRGKVA